MTRVASGIGSIDIFLTYKQEQTKRGLPRRYSLCSFTLSFLPNIKSSSSFSLFAHLLSLALLFRGSQLLSGNFSNSCPPLSETIFDCDFLHVESVFLVSVDDRLLEQLRKKGEKKRKFNFESRFFFSFPCLEEKPKC